MGNDKRVERAVKDNRKGLGNHTEEALWAVTTEVDNGTLDRWTKPNRRGEQVIRDLRN